MACPVRPWPQSPTVPSMLFADEVGVPCMPGVFFDHVDEHTPNIETFVLERFTSHECAQTRSTGQNPTRLFTCSGMQVEELVRAVFGCPTVPHRLCLRRTKCLRPRVQSFDLSAQDRTIVVEELFHPLSLVRGFGRFGWWATHGHVSLSSVGAFRPMSKTLPSGSFSVVHSMPNSANDAIFSAPSDTARSTSAG